MRINLIHEVLVMLGPLWLFENQARFRNLFDTYSVVLKIEFNLP